MARIGRLPLTARQLLLRLAVALKPVSVRRGQCPRGFFDAQFLGGEIGPVRVSQVGAAYGHQVQLSALNGILRQLWRAETPCRSYRQVRFTAHPFGEARAVKGRPTAIIARSVKGKGVSFMENQASWHGVAPNDEQYVQAMEELNRMGDA